MDKRLAETLVFIQGFIEENRYPPTLSDIANGVGLKAKSATRTRVLHLRDMGYISFVDKLPRTIVVIKGVDDERQSG